MFVRLRNHRRKNILLFHLLINNGYGCIPDGCAIKKGIHQQRCMIFKKPEIIAFCHIIFHVSITVNLCYTMKKGSA